MKDRIDSKPRTTGELAAYYSVSKSTFRKWMQVPSLASIRPEVGRYYSIRQVKMIVEHLGEKGE